MYPNSPSSRSERDRDLAARQQWQSPEANDGDDTDFASAAYHHERANWLIEHARGSAHALPLIADRAQFFVRLDITSGHVWWANRMRRMARDIEARNAQAQAAE